MPASEDSEEGKVVGISDGDTIKMMLGGKAVKIRLFEIDAPERSQSFGQKARQFTSELAFGKIVRLESHGEDQFGRILGVIILPDGKVLNEEIVKNGFAWKYKYSDNKKLEALESIARQNKSGLWQDEHPIPPWVFRKKNKKK
jgi:endonuclease YncB( thermonuclease family)